METDLPRRFTHPQEFIHEDLDEDDEKDPLEALTDRLDKLKISFVDVGCDQVGEIIAVRLYGGHIRVSSELCRGKDYEVGVYSGRDLCSIVDDDNREPVIMFDFDNDQLDSLIRIITSGRF